MSDSELPLADAGLEEMARAMLADAISPEEYAARWAHTIACFSLDQYRYRDADVQTWIMALGAILFQAPGVPTLADLRATFLTPEERQRIEDSDGADEF